VQDEASRYNSYVDTNQERRSGTRERQKTKRQGKREVITALADRPDKTPSVHKNGSIGSSGYLENVKNKKKNPGVVCSLWGKKTRGEGREWRAWACKREIAKGGRGKEKKTILFASGKKA
jgi:hypothetical protein